MGWSKRGRRLRTWATVFVAVIALAVGGRATSADGDAPEFEQKLEPPSPLDAWGAGSAVAVHGDWAFVASSFNEGRVDVYRRMATEWAHSQTIPGPTGASDFGAAISATDTVLVVGDPRAEPTGSARVYELVGETWSYLQDLSPTGPGVPVQFGHAVAVDGDVIAVGDPLADEAVGAVSVFRRTDLEFAFEARVPGIDTGDRDNFGRAIALQANTLVVGSPRSDGTLGRAYVFEDDGEMWTELQQLVRPIPDITEDDEFGNAVDIDGDLIVVGAADFDFVGAVRNAGAAYIFRRTDGIWAHEQQIEMPDLVEDIYFGTSVAVDAGRVLVGAPWGYSFPDQQGQVHLFEPEPGGNWSHRETFTPSETSLRYGEAVAFHQGTAIVGAPHHAVGDITTGIAYALLIEDLRTPVFIIPGIAGTYASDPGDDQTWLLNRGIDSSAISVDPLAHAYDDLIQTLLNVGYVMDEDLFVVNYDWRLPPGPIDGVIDGKIDGLSAASLTDSVNSWAVDYLGREMLRALEIWEELHPGRTLPEVDLITHSTGGLVARTYLQCGAYNEEIPFTDFRLPEVRNFIMLAVPNRGASKAWNPLHDNWSADPAYKFVLSKIVRRAWAKVLYFGATISGPPAPITAASIQGVDGPDPIRMIHQYVPTIRGLLATYEFLDTGDGELQHVNFNPNIRNSFVLDLNNGLGMGNETNNFPFADLCRTSVFYAVGVDTLTSVRQMLGNPDGAGDDALVPFTDVEANSPAAGEIWYQDVTVVGGGDGTVPMESAAGLFLDDPRFEFHEFNAVTNGIPIDHLALVSDIVVQADILDILDVDFLAQDIHTGFAAVDPWNALSVVLDPVAGFVVDGQGRRLGWSPATGAVTEIPGSVWFGDGDGAGWLFGQVELPLHMELTGLGEPHEVVVGVQQGARSGGVIDAGDLAAGETVRLDIPIEGPYRNLAVISVKAPKRVKLEGDAPRVHKKVKVVVQNRGDTVEVIRDLTTLKRLLTVAVASRGACPAPDVALTKSPTLPIVLKPGKKLKLVYQVTFTCANDAAKSTKGEDHGDFEVTASVNRTPLDGFGDAYAADDVCPHPPLGVVTGGKKPIKDKGAGSRGPDGRRGAAIVIDLIVK